eukprot:COSAG06_NODE_2581_length_6611_cov_3.606349_3_plen_177_part_00
MVANRSRLTEDCHSADGATLTTVKRANAVPEELSSVPMLITAVAFPAGVTNTACRSFCSSESCDGPNTVLPHCGPITTETRAGCPGGCWVGATSCSPVLPTVTLKEPTAPSSSKPKVHDPPEMVIVRPPPPLSLAEAQHSRASSNWRMLWFHAPHCCQIFRSKLRIGVPMLLLKNH